MSDIEIDDLRIRHVRVPDHSCELGYREHLEMDGPIGPDATVYLDKLLSRLDDCITQTGDRFSAIVYLNSQGGLLSDGYRIGKIFRYHEVQTEIVGGQFCASSCAIAFLGGVHRAIAGNGRLMFHSPYLEQDNNLDCSDQGQLAGLYEYFVTFLGHDNGKFVFDKTTSYCSTDNGWVIDARAADRYNITTR